MHLVFVCIPHVSIRICRLYGWCEKLTHNRPHHANLIVDDDAIVLQLLHGYVQTVCVCMSLNFSVHTHNCDSLND